MVDTGVGTALALPSLFLSCIQCFEYIQYGRNLEKDHKDLVIRLDYIGLGLSRWGASVGFGDESESIYDDAHLERCRPYFDNIMTRFEAARTRSDRFKAAVLDEDKTLREDVDAQNLGLRKRMREFMERYTAKYVDKYKNGINTLRWAIYDKKTLEFLIATLRGDIEDLKSLFPEETLVVRERRYLRSEASGLDDSSLWLMHDIACKEEDAAMEMVVATEVSYRKSRGHVFEGFHIEGSDGLVFRAGDDIASGAVVIGPGHHYSNFKIQGSGIINTGDRYH